MYNLIIIGGGPAGYTAALESRKLGKNVLLIEKEMLGGVCLNRGCIPTKSLLHSSKIYNKSRHSRDLGIETGEVSFNFFKAMEWKNSKVTLLRDNLNNLLQSRGVEIIYGTAEIINSGEVMVDDKVYKTENIFIATGSSPALPDIPGIESNYVLTNREVLQLKERPESLTIIGGGVIGLEFASFFSSIGVRITLIEFEKSLLPKMEKRLSKILEKSLEYTVHLNSKVTVIDNNCVKFLKNSDEMTVQSDYILVATGRKANSKQFNKLGIVKNGVVEVDNKMGTGVKGIYAGGDVTGKTYLAHGSVKMAECAVENMFVKPSIMDFNIIPSVVYTDPEVASVGLTMKEAKESKLPIIKNNFYLKERGI